MYTIRIKKTSLALTTLFIVSNVSAQLAADVTWDNTAATGDWNIGSNWDSNVLPAATQNVRIDNGDTVSTSADPLGAGLALNQLHNEGGSTLELNHFLSIQETIAGGGVFVGGIGGGSGNSGTLSINGGGTLEVGAVENFRISRNNSSGTLNLAAGGALNVGTEFNIGRDNLANGEFNMTGGTLTHTSGNFTVGSANGNGAWNMSGGTANIVDLRVAFSSNNSDRSGVITQTGGIVNQTSGDAIVGLASAASATYNLSDGAFNVNNGRLRIGIGNSIGHTGNSLFNQTGGSVNIVGNSPMVIGDGSTGSNEYRISDGTLNVGNNITVGHSSNGTLTVNGGSVVFTNEVLANRDLFLGNTSNAKGTVNLNGGYILADQIRTGSSTGDQVLNFNGGTLKAITSNGYWIRDETNTMTTSLLANGGTFDTAGFDMGIQDDIGGIGDFTKTGENQVKIGKNMFYSGDTIIDEGNFNLLSTGTMTFYIGADDVNNQITGTDVNSTQLTLRGDFIFDLTEAAAIGNWQIVSIATIDTYIVDNDSFGILGWTDNEDGTWLSGGYTYTESTGMLTAVPEPSAYALLGGLFALGLVMMRRR
jgi:hypothetical protein